MRKYLNRGKAKVNSLDLELKGDSMKPDINDRDTVNSKETINS